MHAIAAPRRAESRRTFIVVAFVVAALDLITKAWASAALIDGPVELPGPVDLQLGYNRGVAFGLLDSAPPALVMGLVAGVTAALGLAAWRGTLPRLPAALILGGATANLVDRLHGGSVVDLLHTGWWPTFNLADTFITVGVILLVFATITAPPTDP